MPCYGDGPARSRVASLSFLAALHTSTRDKCPNVFGFPQDCRMRLDNLGQPFVLGDERRVDFAFGQQPLQKLELVSLEWQDCAESFLALIDQLLGPSPWITQLLDCPAIEYREQLIE